MIAKPSAIQLTDFQLLNLQYRFVNPADADEIDTDELFGRYGVEVDFAIKRHENAGFTIFTKASVNKNAAQPGYVLFAEGVSTFQIKESAALPEAKFQNLLVYSGVGIAMQQLRSRMADLTSFAPLGKYMLPTLDMDDLLKQKQQQKDKVPTKGDGKKKVKQVTAPTEGRIPNTSIFSELIRQKIQQAQDKGLAYIELNAGQLHKEVGGGTGNDARMPACVNAMRQAMKEGDKVIAEPLKRAGASVTIRYNLPR